MPALYISSEFLQNFFMFDSFSIHFCFISRFFAIFHGLNVRLNLLDRLRPWVPPWPETNPAPLMMRKPQNRNLSRNLSLLYHLYNLYIYIIFYTVVGCGICGQWSCRISHVIACSHSALKCLDCPQEKLDTRISSSACISGNSAWQYLAVGSSAPPNLSLSPVAAVAAVATVAATLPRLEGGQWVSFDELETSANCLCSFRLRIFLRSLRRATADLKLAKLAKAGKSWRGYIPPGDHVLSASLDTCWGGERAEANSGIACSATKLEHFMCPNMQSCRNTLTNQYQQHTVLATQSDRVSGFQSKAACEAFCLLTAHIFRFDYTASYWQLRGFEQMPFTLQLDRSTPAICEHYRGSLKLDTFCPGGPVRCWASLVNRRKCW